MADSATSTSSGGWLDGFKGILDAAASGFGAYTQGKVAETAAKANLASTQAQAAAQAAAAQAAAAQAQASAMPWYKAAWVVPAAIAAGVIGLIVVIARSR